LEEIFEKKKFLKGLIYFGAAPESGSSEQYFGFILKKRRRVRF